jgi:non-ribosomal peptide synthase protein (TIGR01720 family)
MVAELRAALVAARDELDAGPGGMARLVWLDRGEERDGRLLMLVHHLAVDGVSWRALIDDVAAFGSGSARTEPSGTSFAAWSRTLAEYATSPAVRDRAELYRHRCTGTDPLPVLRPRRVTDVHGNARRHTARGNPALGAAVLVDLPAALGVGADAVLLAALGHALGELDGSGTGSLLVDLEGHGRVERLTDDLELSTTVGWFTTIAPVRVETADPVSAGPGDLAGATARIRALQEQLRADPDGGLSYGLLRYPPTGEPCVPSSGAEVEFNYLGRFGTPPSAAWGPAPEFDRVRVGFAPDVRVGHSLVIDVSGVEEPEGTVVSATFIWPDGVLDGERVECVARRWIDTLEAWARATTAGTVTRDARTPDSAIERNP